MATEGPVVTATVGDWSVSSNTATKEALESLGKDEAKGKDGGADDKKAEKPDISKSAAELGHLGGKAAAEKRAADAKEAEKAEKLAAKADDDKADEGALVADGEGKEEKLGKPRHDPKARMLEATRKESEAKKALAAERAERERDRAEMQRLRAEFDALKRGERIEDKPKPKIFDPSKPMPEDYAEYEDYLDARDQWNRMRWTDDNRKRHEASAREQRMAETVNTFASKVKEADVAGKLSEEVLALQPTFTLDEGQEPDGSNYIANELVASPETAPALLLYFSEHPDELQRVAALPTPRLVSRALGNIETRLEAATTGPDSERKTVSKAAPPMKPVSGAPYVGDGESGPREGESFDSWYSRTKKR